MCGMAETIESRTLREETRRRYLNYAMSVIMSRALPDVRDGLKPVQRRTLHVMFEELRSLSRTKPRKCAATTGATLATYHPHGDIAAHEAPVRTARDCTT